MNCVPTVVRITDVSPRDGLQNEAGVIPTPDKLRLIELLEAAAPDEIEVTSFVSPTWVPQLADAEQVLCGLLERHASRVARVAVDDARRLPRALRAPSR